MKNFDNRFPYYKGKWKRSIPYKDNDFAIDKEYDEPHAKRKKEILKKYPSIVNLYGPSTKTKYIILLDLILHFLGAFLATKIRSKLLFFLFCYFYGGTLASLAGILIHEATHQLVFSNSYLNTFFGFLANVPVFVPMYSSFTKYHLDHHAFQGVRNKDPDLPLDIEIKMVQGNTVIKIFYIMIYPVFYIGRSMFIKKRILKEEIINIIMQISLISLTFKYLGINYIYYHILSTWIAYSIHFSAAHLIQEHYTFKDGQETYSYYGPLNKLFLNIGYHNEHHDFAMIAWDKLPEVNKIAREYYVCFMDQKSWIGVLYKFIMEPVYGPQSRCVRDLKTHQKARTMKVLTDKN